MQNILNNLNIKYLLETSFLSFKPCLFFFQLISVLESVITNKLYFTASKLQQFYLLFDLKSCKLFQSFLLFVTLAYARNILVRCLTTKIDRFIITLG